MNKKVISLNACTLLKCFLHAVLNFVSKLQSILEVLDIKTVFIIIIIIIIISIGNPDYDLVSCLANRGT